MSNIISQNGFNAYWAEKEQTKRKPWAAKAKRFAERHVMQDDIRKEVFLPLDYAAGFDLSEYKVPHFVKGNPLVKWNQGCFSFHEKGLRNAMKANGADVESLKMVLSNRSIKGETAPAITITDYDGPRYNHDYFHIPNKVFDFERVYNLWLKRMYEICTDVESCRLSYKQITMVINRYTTEDLPFAYYELIPCEQLVESAMLLQETDFYTLNIATLLVEMAAEYDLRMEEFQFYSKKLALRTMESTANAIQGLQVEFWDDAKIEKKLKEYAAKQYSVENVVSAVLQPWKKGVKQFLDSIIERDITNERLVISIGHSMPEIGRRLKLRLDSLGIENYVLSSGDYYVRVSYQGCGVSLSKISDLYLGVNLKLPTKEPMILSYKKMTLTAIAEYIKQMPPIYKQALETEGKARKMYFEIQSQTQL